MMVLVSVGVMADMVGAGWWSLFCVVVVVEVLVYIASFVDVLLYIASTRR